jgi:L-threonylcarbamoyladenylate synthase
MSSQLEPYIQRIKNGEVVAIPTETVYGLAAHAWNPVAINRVFILKNRPSDNPLIIHIAHKDQLDEFIEELSPLHKDLMNRFWPGPLTILFPAHSKVLSIVTAGLPTVALRMPNHPLTLELIRNTGPLVAPSANISGTPSATKPNHVYEDFGSEIAILDGGSCDYGLESTVVEILNNELIIHRPGAITAEDLCAIAPLSTRVEPAQAAPRSPGQKYRHYAPNARVEWMPENPSMIEKDACMLISLNNFSKNITTTETFTYFEQLDWQGDWLAFAKNLYDCFRRADHNNLKTIYIEDIRSSEYQHPMKDALVNRIEKAITRA